jgi:hypothetical protein
MNPTKYVYISLGALVVLCGAVMVPAVHAQVTATMPVIYNQAGAAVNLTNSYLPAGYYYLGNNPAGTHQIYYYGNGTFYDPSIQQYGGSVGDPNGTYGVSLGYIIPSGTVSGTAGLPNTGLGGDAVMNWSILAISALIAIAGSGYLAAASRRMARAQRNETTTA